MSNEIYEYAATSIYDLMHLKEMNKRWTKSKLPPLTKFMRLTFPRSKMIHIPNRPRYCLSMSSMTFAGSLGSSSGMPTTLIRSVSSVCSV
jgi:hypothetical protein